jgi:hypothetical protein
LEFHQDYGKPVTTTLGSAFFLKLTSISTKCPASGTSLSFKKLIPGSGVGVKAIFFVRALQRSPNSDLTSKIIASEAHACVRLIFAPQIPTFLGTFPVGAKIY